MNIEEVRAYALTLPGTVEALPYGPECLVFRIEGKIYLHLWLGVSDPRCAVKLLPEEGEMWREQSDAVHPAYHLNKIHWNDLYLEGLDDEVVKSLIRKSYRLVLSKLPRKIRQRYAEQEL